MLGHENQLYKRDKYLTWFLQRCFCEMQLITITKTYMMISTREVKQMSFSILLKHLIWHSLHKIHFCGIHDKIWRWIKNFLSDQTQEVVVDSKISVEGKVMSGVLQVSLLRPTLFLIYINGLPNNILCRWDCLLMIPYCINPCQPEQTVWVYKSIKTQWMGKHLAHGI